jgi:GTP-binding protein Era
MVAAAWAGVSDADATVLLVDAGRGLDGEARHIVDRLKSARRPAILALNKIDLVRREALLALTAAASKLGDFARVFMISGLKGDGVDDLYAHLAEIAPPGPFLFPPDQLSDAQERFLAAEVTREQVFLQLHDELPYSATVETESWQERPDGSVRVEQVIYVRRTSQRAIVLGEGGKRIKTIGARARAELGAMLDRKVHLFLFVKVRENWLEDPERFRAIGVDFNA